MLQQTYMRLFLAYAGLRQSARRQEGQALVEYALIISLIAVVAIGALQLTGTKVTSLLNDIAGDL